MDAWTDPKVETIVLMTSSQVGKSESFVNNTIGYFIDQDPCSILMVQPTIETAESYSKLRIAPMIADTECLREKVKAAKTRDSSNTILEKAFPGGQLVMAGANSAAGLSSRPIRVLLLDEVDRFGESAGTEGDPVKLAMKRTTTYWNRKIGMCSSPGIKGASRIEFHYNKSDMRRFYVPCPHCGFFQVLKWANIYWDKTKNEAGETIEHFPETAHYVCDECGAVIYESQKPRMLLQGEWRPTAEFKGTAGYHLSELYSPWVRWSEMAENWLESIKLPNTHQVFVNTSLGETWEIKGDAVDKDPLYQRREFYEAELPMGVLAVTLCVDVQADRLELEWRGWGEWEETWGIHYKIIPGDTTGEDVWTDLKNDITRSFLHESGNQLKAACIAIDSGYLSDFVYKFCGMIREEGLHSRCYATKGHSDRTFPVISDKPKPMNYGASLYSIGTHVAKDIVFGRLGIENPGPGFCHFPMEYEEEYFDQVTAEHCVTKYDKTGVPTRRWELKPGKKRNEAWDLLIGNYAAMKILNPDFPVLKAKLQAALEKKEPEPAENKENTSVIPRKPQRRKRTWMNSWK